MTESDVQDVIDALKKHGIGAEYFNLEQSKTIQLRIKNTQKYIASFEGSSAFVYVQYINDDENTRKIGEIRLSQPYSENKVYIHIRTLNNSGEPEKYTDLVMGGRLHKNANIDEGMTYIDVELEK